MYDFFLFFVSGRIRKLNYFSCLCPASMSVSCCVCIVVCKNYVFFVNIPWAIVMWSCVCMYITLTHSDRKAPTKVTNMNEIKLSGKVFIQKRERERMRKTNTTTVVYGSLDSKLPGEDFDKNEHFPMHLAVSAGGTSEAKERKKERKNERKRKLTSINKTILATKRGKRSNMISSCYVLLLLSLKRLSCLCSFVSIKLGTLAWALLLIIFSSSFSTRCDCYFV